MRLIVALAAGLVFSLVGSSSAQAQGNGPGPYGFGFQPFGFYQPYGASYGSSLRTPPYFALNPPVYYGARYARPYGASPFAAPPMVQPAAGYTPRLRSQFLAPREGTPGPAFRSAPCGVCQQPLSNPFLHVTETTKSKVSTAKLKVQKAKVAQPGPIRENQFVLDSRIAATR